MHMTKAIACVCIHEQAIASFIFRDFIWAAEPAVELAVELVVERAVELVE
jgi:hypothetical protein